MNASTNTISTVAIGMPLVIVLAWLLQFWDLDMPGEVQAACAVILSALIGHIAERLQINKNAVAVEPPKDSL